MVADRRSFGAEGEILGEMFVARVSDFVLAHCSTCFTVSHLRPSCLHLITDHESPLQMNALPLVARFYNRNPFQIVFERMRILD